MIRLVLTYNTKQTLKKRLYSDKEAFLKLFDYKYSFATINRMVNDASYCCSRKCMKFVRELFPDTPFDELFAPFNEYHKNLFEKIKKENIEN